MKKKDRNFTYQELADKFGCSKQRIHYFLNIQGGNITEFGAREGGRPLLKSDPKKGIYSITDYCEKHKVKKHSVYYKIRKKSIPFIVSNGNYFIIDLKEKDTNKKQKML